jgi:hypothetical protein
MEEKFKGEVITKLIRQELERSEREGIELYQKLSQESITEEERKQRLREVRGYGLWWGVDSGVYLKEARVDQVKRLGEGLYEVSATCTMEIARARELLPGESPEESTARVRMKINEALVVEEFDFQWI